MLKSSAPLSMEAAYRHYKYAIKTLNGASIPNDKETSIAFCEKDPHSKRGTPIKLNFFALGLCLDGEMTRYINQFDYHITPYTLQLIPPNSIYYFENISDHSETTLILFKESFLYTDNNEHAINNIQQLIDYHKTNFHPIHLTSNLFNRIKNIYDDIEEELYKKELGYLTVIKLLVLKLLVLLKRFKQSELSPLSIKSDLIQTRSHELAMHYLSLIEQHYASLSKVADYAKLLNITPKYLGEIIKEELGKSALFYIHHRKLKESLYLLKHTDLGVLR